ncbi:MAG: hypothetical protein JXQ99_18385 [Hyphomicrobiaceae bacterium]
MSGVSAFLWQAALLLLLAYFIGAFLGCWLRRRYSPPPKVAMESGAANKLSGGAATVALGTAAAAASERFGRALEGQERDATPPAGTAPAALAPAHTSPLATAPAIVPPTETHETVAPLGDASARTAAPLAPQVPPHSSTVTPAPAAPEPVPEAAPSAATPEPPPPAAPPAPAPILEPQPQAQPTALTPPISAATAAAAALAARQAAAAQSTARNAEQAPPAADASIQSGTSSASTPIKSQLEDLAQPVSSSTPAPSPVPAPSSASALPASSGSAGQAIVAAQIEPAATEFRATVDDLSLIEGITPDDVSVLTEADVTTFASVAGWTAEDVRRIGSKISGDRRIARENWIEQAQLLSQTGSTSYTRRIQATLAPRPSATNAAPPIQEVVTPPLLKASEPAATQADTAVAPEAIAPVVPTPPDAPQTSPSPPPQSAPVEGAGAVATAKPNAPPAPIPDTSASATVASQRAPISRDGGGYPDDLKQIDGINAEVEKILHEQGVTRIAQIADWSVNEQQRIDRLLGGMDRINRENWIAQARKINGISGVGSETPIPGLRLDMPADDIQLGNTETAVEGTVILTDLTANAPVTPIEKQSEVGTDQPRAPESNVTSIAQASAGGRTNVQGLRSVRSEALVGATNTVDAGGHTDDLKRIRGIGVLIEKRLRAMGYGSYGQVASWTQSDVDRVSQQLDFRGRIERENWIEQARILAAGGQTEFSRRQETDD